MAIRHLLYERELKVNDDISIVIPTVREVLEQEEEYYGLVSLIIANSSASLRTICSCAALSRASPRSRLTALCRTACLYTPRSCMNISA